MELCPTSKKSFKAQRNCQCLSWMDDPDIVNFEIVNFVYALSSFYVHMVLKHWNDINDSIILLYLAIWSTFRLATHIREDVHGNREDNGAALFSRNTVQGLKIAKL